MRTVLSVQSIGSRFRPERIRHRCNTVLRCAMRRRWPSRRRGAPSRISQCARRGRSWIAASRTPHADPEPRRRAAGAKLPSCCSPFGNSLQPYLLPSSPLGAHLTARTPMGNREPAWRCESWTPAHPLGIALTRPTCSNSSHHYKIVITTFLGVSNGLADNHSSRFIRIRFRRNRHPAERGCRRLLHCGSGPLDERRQGCSHRVQGLRPAR